MLQCGAYEMVITPVLGVPIPGYFTGRPATGVKDDLYAHAAVLNDGKTTIALISLDIIGMSDKMAAAIRERLTAATGIPAENIMVAATHTHTGAPVDFDLYYSEADPETARVLCIKAADCAAIAFRSMQPAKLGFGRGEEYDLGFNRRFILKDGTVRTNPGIGNPELDRNAGPVDPEVGVIRIDDGEGKPLAILVNFACHLDVVGGTEYCADYPGEMNRVIKSTLGNVPVLFFNGCCGDINHIDFWGKHPIDRPTHYKKMGRILAGDVLAIREKIYTTDEVELGAASVKLTGVRRQPTEADVAWAKEYLAAHTDGALTSDRAYAEAYIDLSENPILTKDFEVQALRIGDVGISALPSETFVEIGLDIKANSPFANNFTVELANGCLGYVSTALAQEQKGGYETRLSRYTYMAPRTAKQISGAAVELLNKIH